MRYTPDLSLWQSWGGAAPMAPNGTVPAVAIFKHHGKTLIYIGTAHGAEKSLSVINHYFEKYQPQVVVTEFENSGRNFHNQTASQNPNELQYSAELAAEYGADVILADASRRDILNALTVENPDNYKTFEMDEILFRDCSDKNARSLDELIFDFNKRFSNTKKYGFRDADDARSWLIKNTGWDYKMAQDKCANNPNFFAPTHIGTVFNRMHDDINRLARDPFLLGGIFNAMNKYDVVLATMGEGHFRSQRHVLERAFGKPEIIWDFGNLPPPRPTKYTTVSPKKASTFRRAISQIKQTFLHTFFQNADNQNG